MKTAKKKSSSGKSKGASKSVSKKPTKVLKTKIKIKAAKVMVLKGAAKASKLPKGLKAKTPLKPLLKGAAKTLPPTKPQTKADKKAEVVAQLLAQQKEADVVLTNADGKEYCRVHDCDNEATTDGHCRFHYLALWKRNRTKAKILQGGKLDKYIEDLTSKYPDKYLEMLRKDLASEKDFNLIVAEMDVEDAGDDAEQEEDTNRFIEEVRGGVPTTDDDEGGF